ncbi:MAG: hypothetical protein M4579_001977 [Chaenotheca gracillima]|nr:MAG: hypothetical protein M4579_001977 [Chaenotheca gracillima]
MPSNEAAWLMGAKQHPFQVASAPYTSPAKNQIVIKNGAVATNPLDFIKQDTGNLMFSWMKYPFTMGSDTAGEVVEVGPGVTRFKVGDRVVGHAVGMDDHYNTSAQGAFQTYTVLLAQMTSPIPDAMSYEAACVMPLGLSTAACSLFQKDQLAMQLPSVSPSPTGKTLLVWGGSTSVGCNAIQLAISAGYEVIATSSPRNFAYLKKLGASQVFDYNSPTVVKDVTNAFKGRPTAGAISIGPGGADACVDVLGTCTGNRFLSMATYPLPSPFPTRFVVPQIAFAFVTWSVKNWIRTSIRHVSYKFIFGTTLIDNGIGKAIYEDFLPEALAKGTFVPSPEPQVVGKGLENIQAALDLHKKGVSAKKVVVTL